MTSVLATIAGDASSSPVGSNMPQPQRAHRLSAEERAVIRARRHAATTRTHPCRALCAETGRSYGFTHRLLTDAGVLTLERGPSPGPRTPRQPVTR